MNLLQQGSVLRTNFLFRNYDGCSYAIAGIKLQQANPLGRASGFPDLAGFDADDFAELADHHAFGVVAHQHDARDFAVTLSGLDVDDAFAAARLQPVFVDVGALPVAVLGDGQDQTGCVFFFAVCTVFLLTLFRRDRHADDVILFVKIHTANAIGWTSHGTYIFFYEADCHALVRGQKNNLVTVGEAGRDQFVVLLDANGDNSAGHHVTEVLERCLLDRAVARDEEDVPVLFFKIANRQHGTRALSRLQ